MASNQIQPGFFTRLKQHHIYRVAAWYGASIAVLIQVVARAFPYFGWSVAVPAVIIILIAGFPVTIVLAWLLVKPTDTAAQTQWQRRHWKLGAVVTPIVIAAVVVSGIYAFHFSERHELRAAAKQAVAQTASQAATFNPPADSIVVLPFENLSNNPNQQYFSDGITEELTGALGQSTGLTVIAWETAAHYRDSTETPAEIGKALNVAHILVGSIQHESNVVRVSVELVSTVTGRQLWAAHYDDSLKNIFAVQDQITAAIAGALKVKFAALQVVPTLNPHAHDLYFKGLSALNRYTAADAQTAQDDFLQAVKLDPNYADAWASLAYSYLQLTDLSTLPLKDALPKIRAAVQKALALDPRNASALVELGNADYSDNHAAQAKAEFQQAVELDPNDAHAHMDYGEVLPLGQSLAQIQEAARLNPDSAVVQLNLARDFQSMHDWLQELTAAQALLKLSPHGIDAAFWSAYAYSQLQRGEDAVKAFDRVRPATTQDKQLVDAGRLTYQALLQPTLRPKALAAVDRVPHAGIGTASQLDLISLYMALGEDETALHRLPSMCADNPVSCDDLAINPMYAPLHGEPRFEKLAKQYTTITLGSAPASASTH